MASDLPEELEGIEEELELDDEDPFEEEDEPVTEREDEQSEPERREQFVICAVGDDRIAVHVDAVNRTVKLTDVTRVPRSSDAIEGITDLRGEITAVIDPRILFGVEGVGTESAEQDVVVFQLGRDQGHSGLRIDTVDDVRAVPISEIVLRASELPPEQTHAERLLDSELYAGLLRTQEDGEATLVPIVDVESLVELSKSQVAH